MVVVVVGVDVVLVTGPVVLVVVLVVVVVAIEVDVVELVLGVVDVVVVLGLALDGTHSSLREMSFTSRSPNWFEIECSASPKRPDRVL